MEKADLRAGWTSMINVIACGKEQAVNVKYAAGWAPEIV
jgi:hypothetical protein